MRKTLKVEYLNLISNAREWHCTMSPITDLELWRGSRWGADLAISQKPRLFHSQPLITVPTNFEEIRAEQSPGAGRMLSAQGISPQSVSNRSR